jgi:Ca-activated chloride channel family protein
MTFRSPAMLAALILVPAVVIAYVWSRRQRAARASTLASEGLVTTSFSGAARRKRHVPFIFFVTALTVLVIALARPSMSVRTPRREATVVLAVDVSNSMAATDIKPSRFEAAKTAARAFVNRQPPAVRIGVVAFGPGAVPVLQPTDVHANAIAAINRLTLGGGTSIGDGLVTSLGVIAGKPITIDQNTLNNDDGKVDIGFFGSATIVVFSDGENLSQPDPVAVANVASVAGVRVQSIGVGTEAGSVVKVDGFSVATALNRDLLQQVATVTDGTYHEASDVSGLSAISKSINLHFKVVSEHTEITGLFAAAAVVLLLIGAGLSILWFGRLV